MWIFSHISGVHCSWRWRWGTSWGINTGHDFFYWVSCYSILRTFCCILSFYVWIFWWGEKIEFCQLCSRLYVNLQKIYQAKAEADMLVIEQRVRTILKKIGRDPESISKAKIKSFCKNARKLTVSVCSLIFLYLIVANFSCLIYQTVFLNVNVRTWIF